MATDIILCKLLDDLRADLENDLAHAADDSHIGTCVTCRASVKKAEEACMIADRYCHNHCFTCFACNKSLRHEGYFEDSGRMLCETCHTEESATKCAKCSKPITNSILNYKDNAYHADCFVCGVCSQTLDGKAFFDLGDNNRVCSGCHERELENSAPKCAACDKSILSNNGHETCTKIGEHRYHNDCVVCIVCRKELDDDIRMHTGRLYCVDHIPSA